MKEKPSPTTTQVQMALEMRRMIGSLPIEDLRHLMAAQGYFELGMHEDAHAELAQIDPQLLTLVTALIQPAVES